MINDRDQVIVLRSFQFGLSSYAIVAVGVIAVFFGLFTKQPLAIAVGIIVLLYLIISTIYEKLNERLISVDVEQQTIRIEERKLNSTWNHRTCRFDDVNQFVVEKRWDGNQRLVLLLNDGGNIPIYGGFADADYDKEANELNSLLLRAEKSGAADRPE